jgi:hypothetical protein
MSRRILAFILCFTSLFTGASFASDHDVSARDVKGARKSHRYFWAVAGGTALGAGIGVIAPGGSKSAFKGALIGGSLTSAIYLAKHPKAGGGWRDWAHVSTNAILGTGILWTICNCGAGAWSGALIGGGGTAVIQAMGTHNRRLATATGASAQPGTAPQTPSGSIQPGSVARSTTTTTTTTTQVQPGTVAQPAASSAPVQPGTVAQPAASSQPAQPDTSAQPAAASAQPGTAVQPAASPQPVQPDASAQPANSSSIQPGTATQPAASSQPAQPDNSAQPAATSVQPGTVAQPAATSGTVTQPAATQPDTSSQVPDPSKSKPDPSPKMTPQSLQQQHQ